MKTLVVGSGAVGSFIGWALATAGASVSIVRRSTEASGTAKPIEVVRRGQPPHSATVIEVRAPAEVDVEPALVVIAVKAFDVADALATLPAWPQASFLTVQNGIGSEDLVRETRPSNQLIAGSLTASLERDADGTIQWRRRGGIGLAPVTPPGGRRGNGVHADRTGLGPRDLVSMFRLAGVPARALDDWRAMKWSKLVANLVANATSAIVDAPPAEVYADPQLYEIERAQLREAFAVIRGLGLKPVALPGAAVPRLELGVTLPAALGRPILSRIIGGARGGKDPSLRVGMTAHGEQSEIGWLNGAVAATGRVLGIATPVNAALVELVEAAQADPAIRERFRGRPDELVAAIEDLAARGERAPVQTSPR